MEASALKFVAVGLMAFGMLGAALGVGNIFAAMLNGIARNPATEGKLFKNAIIGAALAEFMGLASMGIGLLLIFQ